MTALEEVAAVRRAIEGLYGTARMRRALRVELNERLDRIAAAIAPSTGNGTGDHRITIDVSPTVFALLRVLGASEAIAARDQPDDVVVQAVVEALVDHAQQGVYRPGSWERGWLHQAFGDAWEALLEPDDRPERCAGDGRVIFQRPRRSS